MDAIYRRLAKRLDKFPHGYPATDSGVELRILEHLFSPEDAAMTLKLKMVPESAAAIAKRIKEDPAETKEKLDRMAHAGQIFAFKIRGRMRYMMAPFVVGIYEFQLPRMNAELAEMFEEYAPTLLRTLGGAEPPLARVIPVNHTVEANAEVLRYESVREMMQRARSFRVMDCICRTEKAAMGEPCNHTMETCLAFSPEPEAYEEFPSWGRTISREEALEVLDRCEQEGLVHCTYNLQKQNMFVCNCCGCCCGFLRGVKEFEAPHLLLRSNWVASIDADECIVCGVCADERCPMDAIVEDDDAYLVIGERCIGCGVCTLECPTDAVSLQQRPEDERTEPPKNLVDWSFKRAVHRSGPFRAIAQFGGLTIDAMKARRDQG
jgi:Fe-S-cluster-containing hydrogenase component 2